MRKGEAEAKKGAGREREGDRGGGVGVRMEDGAGGVEFVGAAESDGGFEGALLGG